MSLNDIIYKRAGTGPFKLVDFYFNWNCFLLCWHSINIKSKFLSRHTTAEQAELQTFLNFYIFLIFMNLFPAVDSNLKSAKLWSSKIGYKAPNVSSQAQQFHLGFSIASQQKAKKI